MVLAVKKLPGYLEKTSVLGFVGAASSRDRFNSRLEAVPTAWQATYRKSGMMSTAGCGLRVTSYVLRGAGCELRVTACGSFECGSGNAECGK